MTLNQLTIDELLSAQWVKSVDWFDEIDSTNSAARRGIHAGLLAPALFVAGRQTAGRGRSDHQWWSPTGCLMMTLAIGSELLPHNRADWSQLALVCGVAVAEAIEASSEVGGIELKWPNDVYVKDRKLAGILIESAGAIASPHWLIGIGLNVNICWSEASEELSARATCLTRESGRHVDLGGVLVQLIERLQFWIVGWGCGELHWLDGWRDRCLLTGKLAQVRRAAQSDLPMDVVGRCEGLDSSGRLVLRTADGLEAFSSAEVVRWE